MTCEEWIDEYQANKRSKDLNSVFNGRKVFDPEMGELSVSMVAEELGVCRRTVHNYIEIGSMKTFRKGHYHVILRTELERFMGYAVSENRDLFKNA